MFLAGTNFTLLYYGSKLKLKKIWKNDEFNWYVMAVILLTFVVTPLVYFSLNTGVEESIRTALFQVVSIITTTGYASAKIISVEPITVLGNIFLVVYQKA